MAIRNTTPPTQAQSEAVTFTFDNGDRRVLEIIKQKWKFKNEESLLRFALATLLTAENKIVTVRDSSGNDISLKPIDDLLTKE